jgi:hypothetical protein
MSLPGWQGVSQSSFSRLPRSTSSSCWVTSVRCSPFHEGGANIALPVRGDDRFRARLSHLHLVKFCTVPPGTALADVLMNLVGRECAEQPVELPLRVADDADSVLIDLGTADGRCLVACPTGWHVLDRSPRTFRRTTLIGRLPQPVPGGDVDSLREIINVSDTDWPLVLGWLVASWFPSRPCPALLLKGEQGTGKSTLTKLLIQLLNGDASPVGDPPKDEQQWAVTAHSAYLLGIDNLSSIPRWLSNALCRTVTGSSYLCRKLYTNDEISVLSYRRPVIINGIDFASVRGDLAERTVIVDLERIDSAHRKTDIAVWERFKELHPTLLGSLLDLLCVVLARLPSIQLSNAPRMADYAQVLRAIDIVRGTCGLETYLGHSIRIAHEVLESDVVAQAMLDQFSGVPQTWTGTAKRLAEELSRESPHHETPEWPRSPRGLASRLRQLAPMLREVGIEAIPPTSASRAPGTRDRLWTIVVEAREQRTAGGDSSCD